MMAPKYQLAPKAVAYANKITLDAASGEILFEGIGRHGLLMPSTNAAVGRLVRDIERQTIDPGPKNDKGSASKNGVSWRLRTRI